MKSTLPKAWEKLVAEEDELLLELVADRVESLCGYKPDLDSVARFLKDNITLRTTLHCERLALLHKHRDRRHHHHQQCRLSAGGRDLLVLSSMGSIIQQGMLVMY